MTKANPPSQASTPGSSASPATSHPIDEVVRLAQKEHDEKHEELIKAIRASMAKEATHCFEIGSGLFQLRDLGGKWKTYTSFEEICSSELHLGKEQVRRYILVSTELPREVVTRSGISRSYALITLSQVLGEQAKPAIVAGEKVSLWDGGPSLDIASSTANELLLAAKTARTHKAQLAEQARLESVKNNPELATDRPRKKRRGRTATPEERGLAAGAELALRQRALVGHVDAVATRPGKPCAFVISGLERTGLEMILHGLEVTPPLQPVLKVS